MLKERQVDIFMNEINRIGGLRNEYKKYWNRF